VQIVREAFEALNGHDLERYAALLHDGYVGETHGVPTPVRGRDAGSHAMDIYFRVLPDFHFVIEAAVAADSDVLVSWLATGTPGEDRRVTSLTARPLQVPGCTVTRLRDGKIAHAWSYWDGPTRIQ
jgi:ketosteroid isomerase-like protein